MPTPSFLYATGLDGDDRTRHTLVISSTESNTRNGPPALTFNNRTRIFTGPDTPVHPGDYIAISPYYGEVEVEGEWGALEEEEESVTENGWGVPRYAGGGEGSTMSVEIVGEHPCFYTSGDDLTFLIKAMPFNCSGHPTTTRLSRKTMRLP